ncbi:GNAT family N-acetyltransferase [Rhizobium sp. RU36D]|uniref:GNAT family N-acetyltransferase n=1 Tax=Rhizobium sp. RU36D TaxID=1907415 RepID=UPI0009D8B62D|nr:GNAT family N-acetyltransferase [Rhizobium sp. RU36D]SMC96460.1 putative acetyltransferase [Rhizobium sp. RU36D]
METIIVSLEPALQTEIQDLLRQSDAVAAALYPGAFRRAITAASLNHQGTHVLVARRAGKAAGLCVLFDRGDGAMELKRMIVDEAARATGVGVALVRAAHSTARNLGACTLLLEVGTRNLAAQALYAREGYRLRDAFAPYHPSPISLFMERDLVELQQAHPDS